MNNPLLPKKRIDFGEKVVLNVTAPAAPAPVAQLGGLDQLVPFATFIPRDLYLELLERKYWEPGFEIQEAVAGALRTYLDTLGPRQPLPPAHLAAILRKNKKLQG